MRWFVALTLAALLATSGCSTASGGGSGTGGEPGDAPSEDVVEVTGSVARGSYGGTIQAVVVRVEEREIERDGKKTRDLQIQLDPAGLDPSGRTDSDGIFSVSMKKQAIRKDSKYMLVLMDAKGIVPASRRSGEWVVLEGEQLLKATKPIDVGEISPHAER